MPSLSPDHYYPNEAVSLGLMSCRQNETSIYTSRVSLFPCMYRSKEHPAVRQFQDFNPGHAMAIYAQEIHFLLSEVDKSVA